MKSDERIRECYMDDTMIVEQYVEEKKNTALKLKALHNTILSLYVELENEKVEQQALDAIECIGFCVNDIKNSIEKEMDKCL